MGDDRCNFCLNKCEWVEHLFMGCVGIKTILLSFLPNKRLITLCSSAYKLWKTFSSKYGAARGADLGTIAVIWWAMWLERNKKIFDQKKRQNSVFFFFIP